jgi:beta-1,2-mannosidase
MRSISATWSLQPFIKHDDYNPCLGRNPESRFYCPVRKETVDWEGKDVFNPAAVVRDDKVYLLYRAEDTIGKHAGTSRIGLAESSDGLTFTKYPEPVFYPDNSPMKVYEWEGGVEDPRIVEDEHGTYYMTYTAYDGDKARLCIATSNDLYNWHKHGLIFGEDYVDLWSKSGSIVCRREGNRLIATRINDSYWMYWGESNIYIAISKDLIHWQPVFNSQRDHDRHGYGEQFLSVLSTRQNRFDSSLVEPGPPALLTEHGILLIYNGRNDAATGDKNLVDGTYSGGQALFDANDPTALIARLTENFIKPDKDYEIAGQVNHVCFLEGLVYFQGRWLLYYGTADSKIAVASCNVSP